jgi:hypothetical protein
MQEIRSDETVSDIRVPLPLRMVILVVIVGLCVSCLCIEDLSDTNLTLCVDRGRRHEDNLKGI